MHVPDVSFKVLHRWLAYNEAKRDPFLDSIYDFRRIRCLRKMSSQAHGRELLGSKSLCSAIIIL